MWKWSRTVSAVLAGTLCLSIVACEGGPSGSDASVSLSEGAGGSVGGQTDPGGTQPGAGAQEAPEGPTDAPAGSSGAEAPTYGEAPTQPTSSVSPRGGDASKVPELSVPSGVDVSADEVRQAIADAAPDAVFPPDVSVSRVTSSSVETSKGVVRTSTWRYAFGKGDALVVAEVSARVSDYGAREVIASVDSIMSPSFDKADGSNVSEEKVVAVAPGITLSGGSVKCAAVAEGVYGVEVSFVADGRDLDARGALPTLTVNGVTLVAQRREGNSTTHGGEERAAFCYSGDVRCEDGKVYVEWCGAKGGENGADHVVASTSNMGALASFSAESAQDVATSVAKAISGRIALCHMSAQEAAGVTG